MAMRLCPEVVSQATVLTEFVYSLLPRGCWAGSGMALSLSSGLLFVCLEPLL